MLDYEYILLWHQALNSHKVWKYVPFTCIPFQLTFYFYSCNYHEFY